MKVCGWHMEAGDHHAYGDRCSLHPGSPDLQRVTVTTRSLWTDPSHFLSICSGCRHSSGVWPKLDPGCFSLITHSLIRTVLRCCSLFGAPPYTATRLGT